VDFKDALVLITEHVALECAVDWTELSQLLSTH